MGDTSNVVMMEQQQHSDETLPAPASRRTMPRDVPVLIPHSGTRGKDELAEFMSKQRADRKRALREAAEAERAQHDKLQAAIGALRSTEKQHARQHSVRIAAREAAAAEQWRLIAQSKLGFLPSLPSELHAKPLAASSGKPMQHSTRRAAPESSSVMRGPRPSLATNRQPSPSLRAPAVPSVEQQQYQQQHRQHQPPAFIERHDGRTAASPAAASHAVSSNNMGSTGETSSAAPPADHPHVEEHSAGTHESVHPADRSIASTSLAPTSHPAAPTFAASPGGGLTVHLPSGSAAVAGAVQLSWLAGMQAQLNSLQAQIGDGSTPAVAAADVTAAARTTASASGTQAATPAGAMRRFLDSMKRDTERMLQSRTRGSSNARLTAATAETTVDGGGGRGADTSIRARLSALQTSIDSGIETAAASTSAWRGAASESSISRHSRGATSALAAASAGQNVDDINADESMRLGRSGFSSAVHHPMEASFASQASRPSFFREGLRAALWGSVEAAAAAAAGAHAHTSSGIASSYSRLDGRSGQVQHFEDNVRVAAAATAPPVLSAHTTRNEATSTATAPASSTSQWQDEDSNAAAVARRQRLVAMFRDRTPLLPLRGYAAQPLRGYAAMNRPVVNGDAVFNDRPGGDAVFDRPMGGSQSPTASRVNLPSTPSSVLRRDAGAGAAAARHVDAETQVASAMLPAAATAAEFVTSNDATTGAHDDHLKVVQQQRPLFTSSGTIFLPSSTSATAAPALTPAEMYARLVASLDAVTEADDATAALSALEATAAARNAQRDVVEAAVAVHTEAEAASLAEHFHRLAEDLERRNEAAAAILAADLDKLEAAATAAENGASAELAASTALGRGDAGGAQQQQQQQVSPQQVFADLAAALLALATGAQQQQQQHSLPPLPMYAAPSSRGSGIIASPSFSASALRHHPQQRLSRRRRRRSATAVATAVVSSSSRRRMGGPEGPTALEMVPHAEYSHSLSRSLGARQRRPRSRQSFPSQTFPQQQFGALYSSGSDSTSSSVGSENVGVTTTRASRSSHVPGHNAAAPAAGATASANETRRKPASSPSVAPRSGDAAGGERASPNGQVGAGERASSRHRHAAAVPALLAPTSTHFGSNSTAGAQTTSGEHAAIVSATPVPQQSSQAHAQHHTAGKTGPDEAVPADASYSDDAFESDHSGGRVTLTPAAYSAATASSVLPTPTAAAATAAAAAAVASLTGARRVHRHHHRGATSAAAAAATAIGDDDAHSTDASEVSTDSAAALLASGGSASEIEEKSGASMFASTSGVRQQQEGPTCANSTSSSLPVSPNASAAVAMITTGHQDTSAAVATAAVVVEQAVPGRGGRHPHVSPRVRVTTTAAAASSSNQQLLHGSELGLEQRSPRADGNRSSAARGATAMEPATVNTHSPRRRAADGSSGLDSAVESSVISSDSNALLPSDDNTSPREESQIDTDSFAASHAAFVASFLAQLHARLVADSASLGTRAAALQARVHEDLRAVDAQKVELKALVAAGVLPSPAAGSAVAAASPPSNRGQLLTPQNGGSGSGAKADPIQTVRDSTTTDSSSSSSGSSAGVSAPTHTGAAPAASASPSSPLLLTPIHAHATHAARRAAADLVKLRDKRKALVLSYYVERAMLRREAEDARLRYYADTLAFRNDAARLRRWSAATDAGADTPGSTTAGGAAASTRAVLDAFPPALQQHVHLPTLSLSSSTAPVSGSPRARGGGTNSSSDAVLVTPPRLTTHDDLRGDRVIHQPSTSPAATAASIAAASSEAIVQGLTDAMPGMIAAMAVTLKQLLGGSGGGGGSGSGVAHATTPESSAIVLPTQMSSSTAASTVGAPSAASGSAATPLPTVVGIAEVRQAHPVLSIGSSALSATAPQSSSDRDTVVTQQQQQHQPRIASLSRPVEVQPLNGAPLISVGGVESASSTSLSASASALSTVTIPGAVAPPNTASASPSSSAPRFVPSAGVIPGRISLVESSDTAAGVPSSSSSLSNASMTKHSSVAGSAHPPLPDDAAGVSPAVAAASGQPPTAASAVGVGALSTNAVPSSSSPYLAAPASPSPSPSVSSPRSVGKQASFQVGRPAVSAPELGAAATTKNGGGSTAFTNFPLLAAAASSSQGGGAPSSPSHSMLASPVLSSAPVVVSHKGMHPLPHASSSSTSSSPGSGLHGSPLSSASSSSALGSPSASGGAVPSFSSAIAATSPAAAATLLSTSAPGSFAVSPGHPTSTTSISTASSVSPRSPSYGRDDVFYLLPTNGQKSPTLGGAGCALGMGLAVPSISMGGALGMAVGYDDQGYDDDGSGNDLIYGFDGLAATLKAGALVVGTASSSSSLASASSSSSSGPATAILPSSGSTSMSSSPPTLATAAASSGPKPLGVLAQRLLALRSPPSPPPPTPAEAWRAAANGYLDELLEAVGEHGLLAAADPEVEGGGGGDGGDVHPRALDIDLYLTLEAERSRGAAAAAAGSAVAAGALPRSQPQSVGSSSSVDVGATSATAASGLEPDLEAVQIRNKLIFDAVTEELGMHVRRLHSNAFAHLRALRSELDGLRTALRLEEARQQEDRDGHTAAATTTTTTSSSSTTTTTASTAAAEGLLARIALVSTEAASLSTHLYARVTRALRGKISVWSHCSDVAVFPLEGPAADARVEALVRADTKHEALDASGGGGGMLAPEGSSGSGSRPRAPSRGDNFNFGSGGGGRGDEEAILNTVADMIADELVEEEISLALKEGGVV